MNLEFLYKGLILGFSVAAPVGPIGILCINRTLNKNFTAGFISGLGAATADLIYGMMAGLGLTAISTFLIDQKLWIQLTGLLFLVYIGAKTLIKKDADVEFKTAADKGLLKDYLSAFILTITNPMTILFFIAVFAGLGLSGSIQELSAAMLLIIGVFTGSCVWWIFLSGLTHQLKTRLNKKVLKKIDLVSGLIILLFAFFILADLVKDYY